VTLHAKCTGMTVGRSDRMGQEDELWEIEKRSGTYRMGFRKGLKEGRAELRKEREALARH
jgi:hypothetical protein